MISIERINIAKDVINLTNNPCGCINDTMRIPKGGTVTENQGSCVAITHFIRQERVSFVKKLLRTDFRLVELASKERGGRRHISSKYEEAVRLTSGERAYEGGCLEWM